MSVQDYKTLPPHAATRAPRGHALPTRGIMCRMIARGATPERRFTVWKIVAIGLALAYAVPIAWNANERILRVNQQARERLIQQHRLWEVHPEYRGKPEVWTRAAARLLSDRQLLSRLAIKYGSQAEAIELEYRRDVAIARAEVLVIALTAWGVPVALICAAVWLARRRRPAPPPRVQPASASDPRYLPPEEI